MKKILLNKKNYFQHNIYVDNNFTAGNPITLTVNGDYLEGTLEHLSNYALVGTNVDKRASNTHTYDNLLLYLTILGVGIIGLSGVGLSTILNNKKD